MEQNNRPLVPNSFRLCLELNQPQSRLDSVLLNALRQQSEHPDLKILSRTKFKDLFATGRIQIKGQKARPSSALARGTTFVDILGY